MRRKPKTKPRTLAEFFEQDGAPTQGVIAKQLGVSPAYISMIAAGSRQPSLGLALEIHKLTGVPAASLVSREAVA